MAITNGYCTLAQVKAALGISTGDTADDTTLERIVGGVSRWIDVYTNRQFFVGGSEARYFTPDSYNLCVIDDAVTVTEVKIDDGSRNYAYTLTSAQYELEPHNAAANSEPYTVIRPAPYGSYRWYPGITRSIKITGTWGITATWPWALIATECTILQSERIFKRKDAPFGIAGVGAVAIKTIDGLDPDIKQMLAPPIMRTVRAN